MVSCIFTLTDDLDAEFPAVAARALGLSRVPLLCAREVPVPGSLPRVIRVMVHYYAPTATSLVTRTSGRRACSERISSPPNRGLHERRRPGVRRPDPPDAGLSAGRRLRPRRRRRDACLERVLLRAAARGRAMRPACVGRRQPLSRSVVRADPACAGGPLRDPATADRARQRLVRHPARRRRGAARAGRRGRVRVAGVQRVPAPGGRLRRAGDPGAARRRGPPRPRRDRHRGHGGDAARADLQPEQPDLDRDRARRDRRFMGRSRATWP